MRSYELMMILNPSLEKEALDKIIAEVKQDMADASVNIVSENVWGKRDLAYPIHGQAAGYYVIYNLEVAEPEKLNSLQHLFNIKKDLWRYMFVDLPKISATPK